MSDNNYWEKRAVDLEKLSQDRADVDIMHVNKLFDGAVDIVEKQIEEIFGKYARDSGISQDAALRLLNEKQTETMRRNLMITLAQCQEEIARQAILARLNAPAYAARISRLEALKDLIHAQAYKVGSAAHYRLTDRLIDTYEQSYYRSIYDQQRRTETGFDFTKLTDRDVQAAIATNWAGSNYSKRVWKNTKKLAESLEEVITQGLMTGQSIRDMELALEARVVSERYKINRIIRTEVNHCCNQGTLMSYKAAGTLRYIYLATLDMRTSSICRSLDKEVFFVSKAKVGVNFPPMHPNCRSTTMAYPEDGIFPKERIARDPETNKNIHVPFDMSYAQWYRKYVLEKKDVDNETQQTTQTQAQIGEATTQPGTQTQGAQQNQATSTASLEDVLKTMTVEEILARPEFKKAVQSASDARVTQALATAKEKWDKEAIENLDEAKKLEKMTAEQRAKYQFDKDKAAFDAEKKAFERQQLVLATGKELIKRGLDASFADVLTGDTAEETADKIDKFEASFRTAVADSVSDKMRGTAPRDKTQGTTITMDSIKSMSAEEINAHWDEVQNVLKQNK